MYHPSNTSTKTQVPTTHDPGTHRPRYHKTTLRADGTWQELAELWLLRRGVGGRGAAPSRSRRGFVLCLFLFVFGGATWRDTKLLLSLSLRV